MRFGMNVIADEGAPHFLGICAKAGVKEVRILGEPSPEIVAALAANRQRAYYLPYRTADSVETMDDLLRNDMPAVEATYRRVCSVDSETTLGVGLPEGLHLLTVPGQTQARLGFRRDVLRGKAAALLKIIRDSELTPVIPTHLAELKAGMWDGLDFDVFDVEMVLHHDLRLSMADDSIRGYLAGKGKRLWYGRAAVLGGFIMPAEQAKFIRRAAELAEGSEVAFLWSEKANERFAWSHDGAVCLEIQQELLNVHARARPVTEDHAIAAFKSTLR